MHFTTFIMYLDSSFGSFDELQFMILNTLWTILNIFDIISWFVITDATYVLKWIE